MSRRSLVFLALGALAVRVVYVTVVIAGYVPTSDADQYERLAQAVAHGKGLVLQYPFAFVHPSAFRPPVYPLLLGGVQAVTSGTIGVGQALNVAFGVAVVLLAAVIGARVAGPLAGTIAGIAVALYPPLLANDGVLLSEPLSLALLLGVILFMLDDRVEWAAVLTGLLVLTRPSAQAFIIVLVAWTVWRLDWKAAARVVLITGMLVAPWVIRNWLLIGTPTLVTSNGFNLAAVYSPQAVRANTFVDPVFDSRFSAVDYLKYNEGEWDQTLRNLALREIRRHPSIVPTVVWRNAKEYLELSPDQNTSAEKLDGRSLRLRADTLFLFYFVTLGGLAGLVLAARDRAALLLLAVAAYFTLFSLFTIAPPRLRAPFDVVCCIGVGVLIARILDARRARAATIA